MNLRFSQQHLLEALDLVQEADDAPAHRLDRAHDLEPAVGQPLARGRHLVEVEQFVLQVEVELLSENPCRSLWTKKSEVLRRV